MISIKRYVRVSTRYAVTGKLPHALLVVAVGFVSSPLWGDTLPIVPNTFAQQSGDINYQTGPVGSYYNNNLGAYSVVAPLTAAGGPVKVTSSVLGETTLRYRRSRRSQEMRPPFSGHRCNLTRC